MMPSAMPRAGDAVRAVLRLVVIVLTAFLTVVDLFAAQAILPALTRAYGVSPAMMGFAVNASTIGMAAGGLAMALAGQRLDRRRGILGALLCLAVPTLLLATLPALPDFTLLRIAQGACMAVAFTLTLAHLGDRGGADTASAFAAYITGNVASNLFGRLISAGVADHFGLAANFYAFAVLNVAGAVLVFLTIPRAPRAGAGMARPAEPAWHGHLRNTALLACFGIGFCILFAFIGTFTFVNFVLGRPPLSLGMMGTGLAYLVFLPSIVTTPLAGGAVRRFGVARPLWAGLLLALAGLPGLLLPRLAWVLAGMVLVAAGTFFAQAVATGAVSRAAAGNRGAASGIYLASYFLGGIAGTLVLGRLFDGLGWPACVAGIAAALALACVLAARLRAAPSPTAAIAAT